MRDITYSGWTDNCTNKHFHPSPPIRNPIFSDFNPLVYLKMATNSYSLFVMGNPLLDMQVTNGEALLEKYKLKANDAILAGDDQAAMYVRTGVN